MKLCIFSDLHIHNYTQFDQDGTRLSRCLQALWTVFETAKAHNCDAIIDCGDLLDRKNNIDFRVYNQVMRSFRNYMGVENGFNGPFYSLVGNHNIASVDGTNNLSLLDDYIHIIDTPRIIQGQGIQLMFIPFFRKAEDWMNAFVQLMLEAESSPHHIVLFAHQEIKGAVTGTHRYVANDSVVGIDAADLLDVQIQRGFFGHYHLQQHFGRIQYVGATLQQDFGEEGNFQGFLIYDTETDEVTNYTLQHLGAFYTIDDPAQIEPGNFYRLRTELKDAPENVIVETVPTTETSNRLLGFDPRDLSQTVQAFLNAHCPTHLHQQVWTLLQTIFTE